MILLFRYHSYTLIVHRTVKIKGINKYVFNKTITVAIKNTDELCKLRFNFYSFESYKECK